MLLRRIYVDDLAQAAYLLGCEHSLEAIVVDPGRDVQRYIDAAEHERLRIAYVTETHIHADFASGARELAGVSHGLTLPGREVESADSVQRTGDRADS